ncbi:MAG: hypothetical protein NZL83_00210 [Candidatus Absconditabacterales bacterium]|nr:hypothetical protein [Candidatus Absconditabacterales bacterium]
MPGKKIHCTYKQNIYDFLVCILTKGRGTQDEIGQYSISDALLSFFFHYEIIIDDSFSNKGSEALGFHKQSSNPNNIDHTLNQNEIDTIYYSYFEEYKKSITQGYTLVDKKENYIDLKSYTDGSTRSKNNSSSLYDKDYLLSCLSTINHKHRNHKLYGSAGGFYAINQLVITKGGECFLAFGYDGSLYTKIVQFPFEKLYDGIFDDDQYNLSGYTGVVFLLANTEYVFAKYGNRGYRFMMIESGSLGFLFRNFYSQKGYLELGGYHDALCMNAIGDLGLYHLSDNTFISHTILLSL